MHLNHGLLLLINFYKYYETFQYILYHELYFNKTKESIYYLQTLVAIYHTVQAVAIKPNCGSMMIGSIWLQLGMILVKLM